MKRTIMFSMKVSHLERRALERLARREHLPCSAVLRRLVLAAVKTTNSEGGQAGHTRRGEPTEAASSRTRQSAEAARGEPSGAVAA